MPHLNFHPAPGFGDLLPGNFVVPQNPIRDAGTPLVPSVQAVAGGNIVRVPHVGELMPGMFVVPQNPIRDAMASPDVTRPVAGSGQALAGLGCGCGAGMGCMCGMGDVASTLSTISPSLGTAWTNLSTSLSTTYAGIPLWALVAGGAAALFIFMPGGSEYRSKRAALRSQYRGYRRAARYAGQAAA